MSSEGLDIPTLNAEFLITPKTDIIQSVGRILRAKHAYSHPIVYDVVDTHDCFKKQWAKRRSYYKKQNYRIIGISNTEYTPDTTQWRTISNTQKMKRTAAVAVAVATAEVIPIKKYSSV